MPPHLSRRTRDVCDFLDAVSAFTLRVATRLMSTVCFVLSLISSRARESAEINI